jgi:hypothetical protein
MDHAITRATGVTPSTTSLRPRAAARTWAILLTSENHGTVGPVGCAFPWAGEKHERVLVVEVPAPAGAPSDQVTLKLVAAPSALVGASVDTQELRDMANQFLDMSEKQDHDESACFSKWGEIITHIDQHVASQVRAARDAAIPDGWKLVPVEPTSEMIDAARVHQTTFSAIYAAMLAAAPAISHSGEGDG